MLLSTTTRQITETTELPTDLPSVYTSTITQSVPMTSIDGSYSSTTVEVLDLTKSTESTAITDVATHPAETDGDENKTSETSTTTELSEISSTETSTSTESSSSFSSIFTTRQPIGKTTKLRPCPPDFIRPTKTSSTTKSYESTSSEKTESESTTLTFPYESSTSSSTQFVSSSDTSTLSSTVEEQSTVTTSSTSTKESSDTSQQPHDSKTTLEAIETESSAAVEVSLSTTDLTTKASTTVEETEKTSEVSLTSTASSTLKEDTTIKATESTVVLTPSTIDSQTESSSFKPPSVTTEEIYTITSTDVANVTGTDCKTMRCFNGGSCVMTSDGPKCVCRFDRQDPNCRSLIKIKNAAFAGDSYLSHMIYSDNHRDFDIKPLEQILPINIELKARTRATDGLIFLAIAQGTKGGHYTALFLHKGLLQFQFSCGLQTMLLSELEAPINTGHEFTVQVALDFSRNHSHCNASLRINDTLAMSGDQPTWLGLKTLGKTKTVNSVWLHLGGSPQTPVVLMSELPGGQGFTGCLHNLKINDIPKEIFRFVVNIQPANGQAFKFSVSFSRDAYDGFGISECGSLACLANPCRNGGTCEEKLFEHHDFENDINVYDGHEVYENRWKCKCPTGYLGVACERSVCENNPCNFGGTCVEFPGSGYLCLCPLGKHGHYCEHSEFLKRVFKSFFFIKTFFL